MAPFPTGGVFPVDGTRLIRGSLPTSLDVLVLAPHPDDAELGMGGTLLKMKAEGLRVGVLDLTNGEPTPRGSVETRLEEARRAAELLDLDLRVVLDLPNRKLQDTLEAREKVAGVIRLTRPHLLFAPWHRDAHPDHRAAYDLAIAARFYAKLTRTAMPGEPYYPRQIVFYHPTHLNVHLQPRFVVDVSDTFPRKRELVEVYTSQFGWGGRAEGLWERMEIRGRYWGLLIGATYGEPFTTEEEVGVRDLRGWFQLG